MYTKSYVDNKQQYQIKVLFAAFFFLRFGIGCFCEILEVDDAGDRVLPIEHRWLHDEHYLLVNFPLVGQIHSFESFAKNIGHYLKKKEFPFLKRPEKRLEVLFREKKERLKNYQIVQKSIPNKLDFIEAWKEEHQ